MRDIPDPVLRTMLFGEQTRLSERFPAAPKRKDEVHVYLITDTFLCHYFLFPLTGSKFHGLIGPYQTGQLSYEQIKGVRDCHQLSPKLFAVFHTAATFLLMYPITA